MAFAALFLTVSSITTKWLSAVVVKAGKPEIFFTPLPDKPRLPLTLFLNYLTKLLAVSD